MTKSSSCDEIRTKLQVRNKFLWDSGGEYILVASNKLGIKLFETLLNLKNICKSIKCSQVMY